MKSIMLFRNQFSLWARRHGIESPYEKHYRAFRSALKETDGRFYVDNVDLDLVPQKEELDKFLRAENAFIALRLFESSGFQDFVDWCWENDLMDLVEKVQPCASKDRNCNAYCKYYGLDCDSLCDGFINMNSILEEYLGLSQGE